MFSKIKFSLDVFLSIILFIATLTTIVLQLALSGSEATKTETALFSILQFVFALAFSWLLTRISLRKEFQESQKKFAISAYRRIMEINIATERLLQRTNTQKQGATEVLNSDLEIIQEISLGIKESIKSSISDWADIIGDEIETIEKIQSIREKLATQNTTIVPEILKTGKQESDAESLIEKLKSKLPTSLRVATSGSEKSNLKEALNRLNDEYKSQGFIVMRGFYEEGAGFDIDIYKLKVGAKLVLKTGDAKLRVGALIAYNKQGKSVGVITNGFADLDSYSEGISYYMRFIGKSQLNAEIKSIKLVESKDSYHRFEVKILDKPDLELLKTYKLIRNQKNK